MSETQTESALSEAEETAAFVRDYFGPPCICGHGRRLHQALDVHGAEQDPAACWGLVAQGEHDAYRCACEEYRER